MKIQTVRPASERLVLTTVQAPLWLEQLNLPGKPIANTGLSVTLHGDLDVSTFVEAVRLVVDETDTLRIRLHMERESVYQEVVDLPDYLVEQVDFSQSSDPVAASDAWIEKHLWETIAWDSFPLFQFTLIKLSPHRHIWLQKSNHLVIDGMGRQLLIKRASEVYEALRRGEQPPPPAGATAAQVIAANEKYLSSDARKQDLEYFYKRLEHLPGSFIRNDLRHSEKVSNGRFTRIIKQISTQEFEQLKSLAESARCSVSRDGRGGFALRPSPLPCEFRARL